MSWLDGAARRTVNDTDVPERILTAEQWAALLDKDKEGESDG